MNRLVLILLLLLVSTPAWCIAQTLDRRNAHAGGRAGHAGWRGHRHRVARRRRAIQLHGLRTECVAVDSGGADGRRPPCRTRHARHRAARRGRYARAASGRRRHSRCTFACGRGATGQSISRPAASRRCSASRGAAPTRTTTCSSAIPLIWQYLTILRPDAVPANADELIYARDAGWQSGYSVGDGDYARGVPLATAFRYDTGVEARFGDDAEPDLGGGGADRGHAVEPRHRRREAAGRSCRRASRCARRSGWSSAGRSPTATSCRTPRSASCPPTRARSALRAADRGASTPSTRAATGWSAPKASPSAGRCPILDDPPIDEPICVRRASRSRDGIGSRRA